MNKTELTNSYAEKIASLSCVPIEDIKKKLKNGEIKFYNLAEFGQKESKRAQHLLNEYWAKVNELEIETLKKRIVRAIKAGNHETRYIIDSCKAELFYWNFCKAIAELQCEGVVVFKPELGYYLA